MAIYCHFLFLFLFWFWFWTSRLRSDLFDLELVVDCAHDPFDEVVELVQPVGDGWCK